VLWIPASAGMTLKWLCEAHSTKFAIDPIFPMACMCHGIEIFNSPSMLEGKKKPMQARWGRLFNASFLKNTFPLN
jgi:hypothetical protein